MWIKWAKGLVLFALVVWIFTTGYRTGAAIESNKQAARESYIRQVYEGKQNDIISAKDAAITLLKQELSEQRAAYSDLQSTASQLRNNLRASTARLSNATTSCRTERELLGQCSGLLGEGSALLEQGVSLLRETATNNDAVVKLINKPNSN